MNITIHRKTMENVRNRINVKLVYKEKDQTICHTKYLTIIKSRYIKAKLH